MGWNTGVEFQLVALQAVMADLLKGDTIHHAFNIPVFGKNYSTREPPQGSKKDIDNAKAVLQYRWIIIDDISMVSAKLQADIDTKIRSLARDVDPYARDKNGVKRPFLRCRKLCRQKSRNYAILCPCGINLEIPKNPVLENF